ncbi:MAG: ATP-binding cassette, subfamily er 3 [Clostridiales bacterium]|jgi:ATP-binding cassette subfamily F protein 3|nr:ATP-binding cassette, subfamily er 3 [Clostridiales bacterium]
MIALSCKGLSKTYGIETILENIDCSINQGDRVGLIGANGAGKTTLMRIIAEAEPRDSGDIFLAKGSTIGYLEQNTRIDLDISAMAFCESVFESVYEMELGMRNIEAQLSDTPEDAALLAQYAALMEAFEAADGYAVSSRIRGVLIGLGFDESDFLKPIKNLSGGQKSRLGIARLLLLQPDILLLDEPTNHLDIDALKWLEDYLKDYPGTLLIISHDRYFLDRVVNKIFEIERHALRAYSGNYSFFARQKQADYEAALKQYTLQQKEVERQESLIQKYKGHGTEKLAKRAKSREKRLDQISLVDRPSVFNAHFKLALRTEVKSGKNVLTAEGLGKKFGDKAIFSDLSFEIYKGDRIGLIGPNGVGKTTLFNVLLGKFSDFSGALTWGHHTTCGYYDQEQRNLSLDKTICEEIHDEHPHFTLTEVRSLLGAFLFTGDDFEKQIRQLSGGERSRVSLLKLMLSNANVLLLDEPTNHLDLYAKEALEEALLAYDGTLIAISHDRYFLNRIATRTFELTENGLEVFWGNYDYCLEKKAEAILLEKEEEAAQTPLLTKTKQKELQKKQKQAQQAKKQLRLELETLESKIAKAEEALHEIDLALCMPEIYTDSNRLQTLSGEQSTLKNDLDALYERLDELLEMSSEES